MMNRETIQIKLIDLVKTSRVLKPIYVKLKSKQQKSRFTISSLNQFMPIKTQDNRVRLNIILPTLRATRVFAGISTALSFFLLLSERFDCCRIIIMSNEAYSAKQTYSVPGFVHGTEGKRTIVFANESLKLPVGKNDIFMFTSWKTAYTFLQVFEWQRKCYDLEDRKAIYLIQDFEPGFFAWSTEYAIAESTYRTLSNAIIAVYNSKELADYFHDNRYSFGIERYFRPALNKKLAEMLVERDDGADREKRILIYGRPSEARNAFEIIRYSLELWSNTYPTAKDWEIVSLGESFDTIELSNNRIVSKGKVTLEEYARYMKSSYVGISLMISPHPSYPPLEMSTFGVRTITNTFANKDLGSFNDNIISIDRCEPRYIVDTLTKVCDEYESVKTCIADKPDYIYGKDFSRCAEEVAVMIEDMLKNENK